MSNASVTEAWKPYIHFLTIPQLDDLIEAPQNLLMEPIDYILPSIEMGTLGPVLTSLTLITKSFMCEVKILPRDRSRLDFMRLKSSILVRLETGRREIIRSDQTTDLLETALVTLISPGQLQTTISYAGRRRSEWLATVYSALFPPSTVLAEN